MLLIPGPFLNSRWTKLSRLQLIEAFRNLSIFHRMTKASFDSTDRLGICLTRVSYHLGICLTLVSYHRGGHDPRGFLGPRNMGLPRTLKTLEPRVCSYGPITTASRGSSVFFFGVFCPLSFFVSFLCFFVFFLF